MVTVLCMDVEPETLAQLQRHRRPPILREADSPAHLIAALEHDPTATEAVVLGAGVDDPLRLVHYAHALDEDLAVLLLATAESVEPLREALGFVPSLRGDVSCARTDDAEALSAAIEEAAKRTQKRRIFRAMSSATVTRLQEAAVAAPLPAPFLVRLLDHSPVGILVLNPQGRIQLGNPCAIDLFALSEKELIGRSFVLLFPESEWEKLSHHLARCSATERRILPEVFRCTTPPGDERFMEITAAPFPGAKGERGTLVFLQDRTLRQQREQGELAEREVQAVQRISSLASFGGQVGQRFQGKLAAIVEDAELLLESTSEPAARGVMQRILDGGREAAAIADQLLTFAGQKPLRLEPVELSGLVRATMDTVEDSIPKRIALCVDLKPDLPSVLADAEHVRAIVRNLVRQAAEAIGARTGQIDVSSGVSDPRPSQRLPCGKEADPLRGPCAYLEVSDDAREKDASGRLQAFDRRSASRMPGADIALAAVLGAVRSQGGSIEVEFPARGGTAFRVLFPLHSAPPRPEAEPESGTLLLFSQEPSTRSVTQRILEHYGLTVLATTDVEEALQLLRSKEHAFHALLVEADQGEPGRDLLAEVERMQLALPVILASSDPESREAATRSGREPAAFLQKPFTVELLIRTVRGVLQVEREAGSDSSRS